MKSYRSLTALALMLLPLAWSWPVYAQTTITWSGDTDTNFTTAGNWVGGVAPTSNLTANIAEFSGTPTANQPYLNAARSINGLNFATAGWALSGPAAVTTLSVGSGGIVSSGGGTNTISARIGLGADQTWAAAAGNTLVFDGPLITGNGNNVTLGSAGNTGTITLNPSSVSYLGAGKTNTLAFGTINVNKAGGLGAANTTIVINDGITLNNTSGGAVSTTTTYTNQINGNFTWGGTDDLTLNGATSLGTAGGTSRTITANGSSVLTLGGVISNGTTANALVKAGAGSLVLSASNTFTGGVVINAGVLRVTSTGSLGDATGAVTINDGGALSIGNSYATAATAHDLVVSGNSTFEVTGSRTWGVAGGSNTVTGSGTLNFVLATSGDALSMVSANSLDSGSTMAFGASAGTFTVNGTQNNGNAGVNFDLGSGSVVYRISSLTSTAKTTEFGSLSGGGNTILEGSALGNLADFVTDTARVGALNTSTTFSGTIRDGQGAGTNHIVALEKVGTGTLTLSGANTYSGATTVTAGTLKLDTTGGSAAGGTTNLVVGNGANLLISKSDQVNDAAAVTLSGGTIRRGGDVSEVFGDLNVSSASFLDFGSGTAGTLSFGTYTASALLTVNNFFEGNALTFGTDLSISINNTNSFKFDNAFTSSWNQGTSTFTITAIPEPSTYVAAAGLLLLLLLSAPKRSLQSALV